MPYAVGEKGQVVIEKGIRDALGVSPGSVAVQTLVADHVEIRFFPPEHNRSLKGVLAKYVQRSLAPEDWASVREQAWDEAIAEDWQRRGKPVEP
jgi:bifunctional DNA-binding transcriptional regulator/antitoxin component of YhaV-PrlF toxin-antitoxin module